MSLVNLSGELQTSLVGYLAETADVRSLSALVKTSRYYRGLVTPLLWRNVDIRAINITYGILTLMLTLVERPELAVHIESLTVWRPTRHGATAIQAITDLNEPSTFQDRWQPLMPVYIRRLQQRDNIIRTLNRLFNPTSAQSWREALHDPAMELFHSLALIILLATNVKVIKLFELRSHTIKDILAFVRDKVDNLQQLEVITSDHYGLPSDGRQEQDTVPFFPQLEKMVFANTVSYPWKQPNYYPLGTLSLAILNLKQLVLADVHVYRSPLECYAQCGRLVNLKQISFLRCSEDLTVLQTLGHLPGLNSLVWYAERLLTWRPPAINPVDVLSGLTDMSTLEIEAKYLFRRPYNLEAMLEVVKSLPANLRTLELVFFPNIKNGKEVPSSACRFDLRLMQSQTLPLDLRDEELSILCMLCETVKHRGIELVLTWRPGPSMAR